MSGTFSLHRRTPSSSRVGSVGGLVLVALGLTGAGYLVGSHGDATQWRVGVGHVATEKASFETPDWVYGIDRSVAWLDVLRVRHDRGWPDCLDVPAGTTIAGVRFATVDVELDGLEWQPVVLVDCRKP